jgi:hypothetical protein
MQRRWSTERSATERREGHEACERRHDAPITIFT